MRVVDHGHLMRRSAVGAVVAVVLVAALAAPALAARPPTTWTVSPQSQTITYGQGVILNGTLRSGDAVLGGLWVDFYQATTETGSGEFVYKVTAPDGPYATGDLLRGGPAAADHVLPVPVGRRPHVRGERQRRHPRAGQAGCSARPPAPPVQHRR